MMLRKKFALTAARPSRLRNPALGAVIALLSVAVRLAQADTIVSSLSNTLTTVGFTHGSWVASPFQTGFQSWTLTNVTLSMPQGSASSSLADVRVFSDNAGQPGISLADLGVQTITGSQQLWSFAASTDIELASGTTYWIGVGNVSTDQGLNVDLVSSPPFTFTFAPGAAMTFSGASSTNGPTSFDPSGVGTALPFQADGISTGVPEPGPFACLFVGGATLFVFRRLHRQSTV